jgi:hypothetical protein
MRNFDGEHTLTRTGGDDEGSTRLESLSNKKNVNEQIKDINVNNRCIHPVSNCSLEYFGFGRRGRNLRVSVSFDVTVDGTSSINADT